MSYPVPVDWSEAKAPIIETVSESALNEPYMPESEPQKAETFELLNEAEIQKTSGKLRGIGKFLRVLTTVKCMITSLWTLLSLSDGVDIDDFSIVFFFLLCFIFIKKTKTVKTAS